MVDGSRFARARLAGVVTAGRRALGAEKGLVLTCPHTATCTATYIRRHRNPVSDFPIGCLVLDILLNQPLLTHTHRWDGVRRRAAACWVKQRGVGLGRTVQ